MTAIRLFSPSARSCLLVLLAAVAAASTLAGASEQIDVCPQLTMNNLPAGKQLKAAVLQACSTNSSFVASPASCGPCQCALVGAVAPLLQDSGDILPAEMYTANAVKAITAAIKNCSREFALQLLEDEAGLKLSQLLSLEGCVADEKTTIQCMSQPNTASAANTSKTVPAAAAPAAGTATFGDASDGSNTLNELLRDASCALAAAGNNTDYADNCSSSVPATSSWIIMAPVNTDPTGHGLKISSKNSRGPVAWKAGCWCDDSYDPVCDAVTRKQYPNSCSAKCQLVSRTVPCSSLPPLIQKSQIPGTAGPATYVYDESMVNPNPVAFQGPVPPAAPLESDKSTQMFYYYYDDDVDDTQDARDITAGFYKALMAANYGDKTSNAAVVSKSVAAAITAVASTKAANNTVRGLDGAADNSTMVSSVTTGIPLLDNLRNASRPIGIIARLREGTPNSGGLFGNASGAIASVLSNVTQAARSAATNTTSTAPERRSSVSLNVADQPALPAWLSTQGPDQVVGVYTRSPGRTSRILAALQATAKKAGNEQQAAEVVVQLGPGLQGFIEGVQEAVTAQSFTPAVGALNTSETAPTGGLFRGALTNNTLTSFRTGNRPFLQALNSTVSNATAALANNSATPSYNATSFDQMLENLDTVSNVRDLISSPAAAPAPANRSMVGNGTGKPVAAFRGAVVSNMSAVNSTGAQLPVKAASGPNKAKQNTGRRLLSAWR